MLKRSLLKNQIKLPQLLNMYNHKQQHNEYEDVSIMVKLDTIVSVDLKIIQGHNWQQYTRQPKTPPPPPSTPATRQYIIPYSNKKSIPININKMFYLVFVLETTVLSKYSHNIIYIAAHIHQLMSML